MSANSTAEEQMIAEILQKNGEKVVWMRPHWIQMSWKMMIRSRRRLRDDGSDSFGSQLARPKAEQLQEKHQPRQGNAKILQWVLMLLFSLLLY
jgi:hypothetical protein